MWTFAITSGTMTYNGIPSFSGAYSGHGLGVNNPDMQDVAGVGPIPVGMWTIGPPRDSPKTGPFIMDLHPLPTTETYGRSGFEIHGDEIENPGKRLASDGCIVLPRSVREQIASSGDTDMTVTV